MLPFFVHLLLKSAFGLPRLPPVGCLAPLLHSCMWSIFLPFVIPNFRTSIYDGETSVTSCFISRWKCHVLTLPLVDLLCCPEQATVGQFQPQLVIKFIFKKEKIKIKLNKDVTLIFVWLPKTPLFLHYSPKRLTCTDQGWKQSMLGLFPPPFFNPGLK